jgi:hypothetical protein
LALQVFGIKPFGEKPESAGLAPAGGPPALWADSPWAQCDLLIRDQPSRRVPCASAFLTSDCEIPNCLAIAEYHRFRYVYLKSELFILKFKAVVTRLDAQ